MDGASHGCTDGVETAWEGGFRLTVASRLMLALAATAALAAALAMALQDRSLAADLERAAERRLDRAARAAGRLAQSHLEAMGERYRAISRTPELRANLEVDHAPTLDYYAHTLRSREGAELVAFSDRKGRGIAVAGNAVLLAAARGAGAAGLIAHAGNAYAVVSAELRTSAGVVGHMLAAERLEADTLADWSALSGVDVSLTATGAVEPGALTRVVRSLDGLDLVVTASLDAEHEALRRSRTNLLVAGCVAVGLSLVACALLARGFVRPILAIQHATERIRRGDLDVRLASQRRDEIGDVARAFDVMLEGLSGSRREIEQHLAELRRSQQHLANAQQMARLGSFELDFDKGEPAAVHGSEQLWKLFQVPPGRGRLDPAALLERIHPEDRNGLYAAVRDTVAGGNALNAGFRLQLPDGSERIVHAQAKLVAAGADDAPRLGGTVQDVTDRHRAEEQIRYLAHHDTLTGLGNRRLFAERAEVAIAKSRRRSGRLGILLVDLDQFKRINDTLGANVGDEVLRCVADRLVRSLRSSDVVARRTAQDCAVSRLAGDEFTLLLDDVDDPQDLAFVAKRILDTLGQPLDLAGHELVLGASIGIAAWPTDGEDLDTLLRSAGSATQHAKRRGGGQYQFYDESMNVAATEALELESRMRRALSRGEFEMHYQPKLALRDGRVSGYEALLRWRDPDLGLLPPGHFIPVAEQCGLILPLGEFALREACHQLAAWERELPDGEAPRVAVNLSAHQFKTGTLVRSVAAILEESGARPERLELEITESALLHDEKRVVQDLEELRGMGIAVALDDFGTGQSSLSHLRRLPVDTLKIDMSFVRSIAENEADARITAAIVAMGHARGLCVVAEGVETEAQRRLLAEWGCDEIQGFLVSPALPAGEALQPEVCDLRPA
jgi:diguanylate cyclase (GGDEF)-like protein